MHLQKKLKPPGQDPSVKRGVKAVGDSMVAKLKEATGMAGFEKLHGPWGRGGAALVATLCPS